MSHSRKQTNLDTAIGHWQLAGWSSQLQILGGGNLVDAVYRLFLSTPGELLKTWRFWLKTADFAERVVASSHSPLWLRRGKATHTPEY